MYPARGRTISCFHNEFSISAGTAFCGDPCHQFVFCHICIISIHDFRRQVQHLVALGVHFLDALAGHAAAGVVVQPQFYGRHFRVAAQELLQRQRLFLGSRNTAQRQSVLVRFSTTQRHFCHGIYGGFKHRYGAAFPSRWDTEPAALIAAFLFDFERLTVIVNTAQGGVLRHALLIQPQEHTVVVACTLIQDF